MLRVSWRQVATATDLSRGSYGETALVEFSLNDDRLNKKLVDCNRIVQQKSGYRHMTGYVGVSATCKSKPTQIVAYCDP